MIPRAVTGSPQPCKAGLEVGEKICRLLQTSMEAQECARLIPYGRRTNFARIIRHNQAFITAPGSAKAKILEPVDQGCKSRLGQCLEYNRKQTGSAAEIPLPQRMSGMISST